MVKINEITKVRNRNKKKDYDAIMYRVIMYREQPEEAEKNVKNNK